MKIVLVSPHRDDAAFCLGLSLEHWIRERHTLQVLNCFTQSEFAPYSDVDSVHANDKVSFVSAVRKREDVAWNKMLRNAVQFTDLDLVDAPQRLVLPFDEIFTTEIRAGDRALARVAGAIRKAAARDAGKAVAFLLPLGLGGHIDHRVTRQAGLEVLGAASLPYAFYEDLPYAAFLESPEPIAQLAAEIGPELTPIFVQPEAEDVAAAIERKRRMAECYDSQVDTQTVEKIARYAERYGGRERLWASKEWIAAFPGTMREQAH